MAFLHRLTEPVFNVEWAMLRRHQEMDEACDKPLIFVPMPFDHLIVSNACPHLCRWTDFKHLCTLVDVLRIAFLNRESLGGHGGRNAMAMRCRVAGGGLGPQAVTRSFVAMLNGLGNDPVKRSLKFMTSLISSEP